VSATDPDAARRIFRYVTSEEWRDYRAIISVFADTFFAEFSPDDVSLRLAEIGHGMEPSVVPARLEQLHTWGNLTVSSSVGSPASLADYYKRRNRYLITPAGQQVHGLVEGVLTHIDEVRDVSAGRLRTLRDALVALAELAELGGTALDPTALADAVRAVFDPHLAFTEEVTQFFAAINQWQARFDLDADEFRFFAEVLVGYVGDRLDEIERLARPIGQHLARLQPIVPAIIERMAGPGAAGLAERVEQAGLGASISVSRQMGTTPGDWQHLEEWFLRREHRPSRIDRLSRDAVAAIRTLTMNLTRLSRIGIGANSRRINFLALAGNFDTASDSAACHRLAAEAFGVFAASHFGVLSADADDPEATTTSWWDAPRAAVAVSMRERGDRANRGNASPLADRSAATELLRRRRAAEHLDRALIDQELLDCGDALDGGTLSSEALRRLQGLLAKATHRPAVDDRRTVIDEALRCQVRSTPGHHTAIGSPAGTLTLLDLSVVVDRHDPSLPALALVEA